MNYKNLGIVSTITGTVVAGTVAATLWFQEKTKLYQGPIDIAGVERVEARQVHEVCHQFLCLRYAGNIVEINFTDGNAAKVRDHAGDFRVNDNDTIDGKIQKSVDVNKVLDETRRKSGDITYLSFY